MNNKYMERIKDLLVACKTLAESKKTAVIVLDGRAASGKSTLAVTIAGHIGGYVVRADDFFLPFDMRTAERLAEPGGNIHHERFAEEVINCLGSSFDYGIFDCSAGTVLNRKHIEEGAPVIIEGAYSASPVFGKYYDLLVFVTADLNVRIARIKNRNGIEKAQMFKDRWIPLEESYFDAFNIEGKADIIIDTTDV